MKMNAPLVWQLVACTRLVKTPQTTTTAIVPADFCWEKPAKRTVKILTNAREIKTNVMKTRSVKIPLEATRVSAKMDLKAMAVSAVISMNAKTPLTGYYIMIKDK